MIDTIMRTAAQAILLILSFVLYVFIISGPLPKILLNPKYSISEVKDRGLRRFTFDEGRAIAYQPSIHVGKYIKQYILSSNGDEKYIKCKIDERIYSIKLDVVAFNADDKAIGIIQVTEKIQHKGFMRAALLPSDAAYVTLIVKEINGAVTDQKTRLEFSWVKLAVFAALSAALSAAEALALTSVLRSFAANVLSIKVNTEGTFFLALVSALLGLLLALLIWLLHLKKDTKIGK